MVRQHVATRCCAFSNRRGTHIIDIDSASLLTFLFHQHLNLNKPFLHISLLTITRHREQSSSPNRSQQSQVIAQRNTKTSSQLSSAPAISVSAAAIHYYIQHLSRKALPFAAPSLPLTSSHLTPSRFATNSLSSKSDCT